MKILILGGTRFLGRHLVEAAVARGHELTLFHRGRSGPALFPQVERLIGDRDGALGALEGARRWDAVIDTCGFLPRIVRASAQCLAGRVNRYAFVSSVSVYADMTVPGLSESAACAPLGDAASEDIARDYGALKAACEREVDSQYGDRALVIRPGLIVGPFDPTGRFTYWPIRVRRGGDVLAPAEPEYPVQLIDARDLAAWTIALVERDVSGCFNACGPAEPLTLAGFLQQCRDTLNASAKIEWVSTDFLDVQGVRPWLDLPLWAGDEARGLGQVSIKRALDAGLRLRPLSQTIVDTAGWASGDSRALPDTVGLAPERERSLLETWRSHRVTV